MLKRVKYLLDKTLELLVTLAMAILVIDVVWQVFTRYVMKSPSTWTEELATFLMIWVGMLGSSVALNRGSHLGIDYFVAKFSNRKKLCTEMFIYFSIAVFSFAVLIVGGASLVCRTLALNQLSPALQLKMGYVYLALPISGLFLVLYSIEFFIESLLALIGKKTTTSRHDSDPAAAID